MPLDIENSIATRFCQGESKSDTIGSQFLRNCGFCGSLPDGIKRDPTVLAKQIGESLVDRQSPKVPGFQFKLFQSAILARWDYSKGRAVRVDVIRRRLSSIRDTK
jgi:hypothetical protein